MQKRRSDRNKAETCKLVSQQGRKTESYMKDSVSGRNFEALVLDASGFSV